MSTEAYEIVETYPAGLKRWDGRSKGQTHGFKADVVILRMSKDGRHAMEYAFNFAEDAVRVLGMRESYLSRPKVGRWDHFPSEDKPWVPYGVFGAAVRRWLADEAAAAEMFKQASP